MTIDPIPRDKQLVKSKQRIAEHGEVFTPSYIVEAMLDLIKSESERIDSRILEPAWGEGNFLTQVLIRKLVTVQNLYRNNEFERRHYALLGLMCTYGIEILEDNVEECRKNLAKIFDQFIDDPEDQTWCRAAKAVLDSNIVQADALTMRKPDGSPLIFPEWGYLGKGKFQRRDFKYDNLTRRSSFSADTLFGEMVADEIFTPLASYKPITVMNITELRKIQ